MKLITESSYDIKVYEDNTDKSLKIVGIFSSAETTNGNGRKYPKKIFEREVDKIMEKIEGKCLWGELSHPPSAEVNPERISHIVESLEWKNNDLYGKARVLSTPMGNIAKELIKEGKVGISSRGLGTVSENGQVNEDFSLLTWDIVTNPSNGPSWVNGMYEGKEFFVSDVQKEPNAELIEEAKMQYKRHIWQVLEKISKEI